MASKPENHVTRAIEASRKNASGGTGVEPFPDLTRKQVEWLRHNFPQRCYSPMSESIEQHLMYHGMVILADTIAQQWDDASPASVLGLDADAESV